MDNPTIKSNLALFKAANLLLRVVLRSASELTLAARSESSGPQLAETGQRQQLKNVYSKINIVSIRINRFTTC